MQPNCRAYSEPDIAALQHPYVLAHVLAHAIAIHQRPERSTVRTALGFALARADYPAPYYSSIATPDHGPQHVTHRHALAGTDYRTHRHAKLGAVVEPIGTAVFELGSPQPRTHTCNITISVAKPVVVH